MLQITYLILCILGTALSYSQFIPFLLEKGLNINAFFEQLFANQISGFFVMDVIVSSVFFRFFVFSECSRLNMKNLWIYIATNLLVGVSLGLPLFLLMRQRQLEVITLNNNNKQLITNNQ
jgi:Terpene cyclase DEP1